MMKNRVQVFILLNSGQQKLMASSRDPLDVTVDGQEMTKYYILCFNGIFATV